MDKKNTKNWQKILKKPEFYFGVAAVIFFIVVLVFVFPKYNEYITTKTNFQEVLIKINGDPTKGNHLGAKVELNKIETEYNETKKAVDQRNSAKNEILDIVLPAKEDINFLTQLFERYAIDHDSANNPFILNSISFSSPKNKTKSSKEPATTQSGMKATTAQTIPIVINLPIEASEKNFNDFIQFINDSGSIKSNDFYREELPVPIMTIESLNFTYHEDEDILGIRFVNATFVINTYIRLNSVDVSTTK